MVNRINNLFNLLSSDPRKALVILENEVSRTFVFYTRYMKNRITIVFVTLFLLLVGYMPCAQARTPACPSNWYELYSRGNQELDAQNFVLAEDILHEARQACSDNFCQSILTLDSLETVAERQSDYKSAEKYLIQSLQILKKNNFLPRRILGLVYLKLSLVNYYKKDFHRSGFYALLAVPALEETVEEEEYSVITIDKVESNKHKTHRLFKSKKHAHKTGSNQLKSLDFGG